MVSRKGSHFKRFIQAGLAIDFEAAFRGLRYLSTAARVYSRVPCL